MEIISNIYMCETNNLIIWSAFQVFHGTHLILVENNVTGWYQWTMVSHDPPPIGLNEIHCIQAISVLEKNGMKAKC